MTKILFMLCCIVIYTYATEYTNLNLQDAMQIVKKQNLEINISEYDEKISAFTLKISKGNHLGKLDFTQTIAKSNDAGNVFGYKLSNRDVKASDFEPQLLNHPDSMTLYQQKLTYELPLYTGGKISNYDEIMSALKSLATLNKEDIIAQKIYEVKKSFYDISLLNSSYNSLSIILDNISTLQATVQAMYDEGYAKNIDVLEVEAKKANIQRTLNQIEANKDLAYQYLGFLLDADVKSIQDGYDNPTISQIPDDIISQNLDVKKAIQQLEISKKQIKVEQSAYYPQIGFIAQYQASDDKFGIDYDAHNSYAIGLQLKLNLFDGLITTHNVDKARVANLKAQNELELTKKRVQLQISSLLTEIKNYNYHINSLNEEIKLSKTIYENYLGRYKEKLVSINDVITKQSNQIEDILKLKEIENKRNQKIFELDKILNKGNL